MPNLLAESLPVSVIRWMLALARRRVSPYIGGDGLRFPAGETYSRGLIDLEGSCP